MKPPQHKTCAYCVYYDKAAVLFYILNLSRRFQCDFLMTVWTSYFVIVLVTVRVETDTRMTITAYPFDLFAASLVEDLSVFGEYVLFGVILKVCGNRLELTHQRFNILTCSFMLPLELIVSDLVLIGQD